MDLSTLNSVEEFQDLGWIIADGWQSGGVNSITKQVPIGRRENVGIAKGEGLTLKVPRTFSLLHTDTALTRVTYRTRQELSYLLRRRNTVPRRRTRRNFRGYRKIDVNTWNVHGHLHQPR